MRPKRFYRHMDPTKASEIRKLYFSRAYTQAELAALYQVRQNTVSRIISGMVWTEAK